MVNVSKKKLDGKTHKRLTRDIIELLAYPKTNIARIKLLEQFFTPTERTLFAKRIALILMLENKVPFNVIERELSVSSATVRDYQRKIRAKKYTSITTALKHLYDQKGLTNFLAVLFATRRGKKLAHKELRDLAKSLGARYGTY